MKFLLKLGLCVWSTWSKFQVNPLSIHDLTVLSSKGPQARKPPFFNGATETAIFRDGEDHAFVAAKQSRLYRTFNAVQNESRGGPYDEAGRQKRVPAGLIAELAAACGCNSRMIRRIGAAFQAKTSRPGAFDIHRCHEGNCGRRPNAIDEVQSKVLGISAIKRQMIRELAATTDLPKSTIFWNMRGMGTIPARLTTCGKLSSTCLPPRFAMTGVMTSPCPTLGWEQRRSAGVSRGLGM